MGEVVIVIQTKGFKQSHTIWTITLKQTKSKFIWHLMEQKRFIVKTLFYQHKKTFFSPAANFGVKTFRTGTFVQGCLH